MDAPLNETLKEVEEALKVAKELLMNSNSQNGAWKPIESVLATMKKDTTLNIPQTKTQLLLQKNAVGADLATLAKYDAEFDENPKKSDDAARSDAGTGVANVNQPTDGKWQPNN